MSGIKDKKLFIGIPNSQTVVYSKFFWSVIGIRPVCRANILRTEHSNSEVRNNALIGKFLEGDCDYFVKLDVDQTYPPDYFEKMVPLIDKYKCIGPVIYDRWPQNKFLPLVWGQPASVTIGKTGIEELPYLHTNCFFAREVLEKIPPPWYEIKLTEDGQDRAIHVDRHFMAKVPAAGYKIYINYDVTVKHIAEVEVDSGVCIKWNR